MSTTADDVWQLLAELVTAQKETERRFQETERRFQETERRFQETDRQIQETSKEVKKVSKQIGALGGKWGRFVENMVAPA
ncbi:MAG: MbeD/MobD family mobilization/exclusion protein, partial [Crocosphaera sp.]